MNPNVVIPLILFGLALLYLVWTGVKVKKEESKKVEEELDRLEKERKLVQNEKKQVSDAYKKLLRKTSQLK